jgi:hypothetical protein
MVLLLVERVSNELRLLGGMLPRAWLAEVSKLSIASHRLPRNIL